jgi:hypothetical protein
VANAATVFRTSLASASLTFTTVGTFPAPVRGLAWSDHFGGAGQAGLYVQLAPQGTITSTTPYVMFITPSIARGTSPFSFSTYLRADLAPTPLLTSAPTGITTLPDGGLLHHTAINALRTADSTDTRLGFEAWIEDEFAQSVQFAKGLVSPDGEPAGWVTDADVVPEWNRFHPATPDGAAWVILLCLMNDELFDDPQAQALVRTILTRYAGLAVDGIAPSRSADGIFRHWIDPRNGDVKPGWDPEYATLSTMKIVLAAARARAY